MGGAVSWAGLWQVLMVMGAVIAVVNGMVVYWFTSRNSDMDEVRKMLAKTMADVEIRYDKHHARIDQEHANLHERINRANEKTISTERVLRSEMSAMLDKAEERLTRRIDGVLTQMRSISGDIIKAVHERRGGG